MSIFLNCRLYPSLDTAQSTFIFLPDSLPLMISNCSSGAFLIPYLIMLFVLGIPLFYLELSLGQAVRKGPVLAWFKISPNLGGIGVSALIVNSFIVVYYNVIIAWVLFYLFNVFHKNLPWGVCFGYVVQDLDPNLKMELLQNNSDTPGFSSCFNATTELVLCVISFQCFRAFSLQVFLVQ